MPATDVPGRRVSVLLLVALGLLLLLPGLGDAGLWDPWEPKYAQTAREMAASGDWVVPHYREDPRLVKPPLTYWSIGLSHAVFGVTEFAARLPSAILALLCPIALALALGARGQGFAGLLTGLALLTSPQWLLLGRSATPDMLLASLLGMLLAVAIAYPAFESPRTRSVLGFVAATLLAGAMLTDGPRALLLPAWSVLVWAGLRSRRSMWVAVLGVVVVTYAVGQQIYQGPLILMSHGIAVAAAVWALTKLASASIRRLAVGAAFVAAVVGTWYVAVTLTEPTQAVENLLGYKHALNLGESIGLHTESFGFVARVVSMGSLPWIGASVVGLILAWRTRRRDGLELIVAATAVGMLLFFTASEAKMGHFYGVLQPALAGMAGLGLAEGFKRRDWVIVPGLLVLLATCAGVLAHPRRLLDSVTVFTNLHDKVSPAPWLVSTAVVWLGLVALAWFSGRRNWLIVAAIPAAVFAGYMAHSVVPTLGPQKSFRDMWVRYDHEHHDGERLGAYGWSKDSVFYYSNNAVVRLKEPDELRQFLAGPRRKFVIAPFDSEDELLWALPSGARWRPILDNHAYHMLVEFIPPDL